LIGAQINGVREGKMRALFSLRVLERRSQEKGALCSLFG
jgi:hypothetical protein